MHIAVLNGCFVDCPPVSQLNTANSTAFNQGTWLRRVVPGTAIFNIMNPPTSSGGQLFAHARLPCVLRSSQPVVACAGGGSNSAAVAAGVSIPIIVVVGGAIAAFYFYRRRASRNSITVSKPKRSSQAPGEPARVTTILNPLSTATAGEDGNAGAGGGKAGDVEMATMKRGASGRRFAPSGTQATSNPLNITRISFETQRSRADEPALPGAVDNSQ